MSEQSEDIAKRLQAALWRIYRRPERPFPWTHSGNLPWNDPAFSERMLREHLDDSHGAASRNTAERTHQLRWLMEKLAIAPGKHVLDVTCGPGLYAVPLAQQGITVTGVDFSPAAIAYARDLAKVEGVADLCQFIEADIRDYAPETAVYDAALFLYGQLAVFPRHQAQTILTHLARALKPGGRLCVELLNQEKVDKTNSNWWFTDNTGLWGDTPFLHLGERFWLETEKISVERYLILHLESGQLDEIHLCDQTYAVSEMEAMMYQAGFQKVTVYPAWDGLPLYDADEWIVYVATR
ncbi:MAG: class I SAM-dependent methyltransferase [Chloroflexi bacterium]|nr:MAG: class I SAM-dependent methyltransferase [Chloroflexota bacterium]